MYVGLQELNLSHNLLSTWDEVATITAGLHRLHSLNISENRLAPPPDPSAELSSTFGTIRTLFVNKMNLEWIEVLKVLNLSDVPMIVLAIRNSLSTLKLGQFFLADTSDLFTYNNLVIKYLLIKKKVI